MKRFPLILALFLFCPGCNRYGRWAKDIFKQADTCFVEDQKVARDLVRREPVYEPLAWKTIDIVYALPMNNLVERVHDQLNCCCACGQNCPVEKLVKNPQYPTRFYVMMDGDLPTWCFVLKVDEKRYKPALVKKRDLDRGLKGLLGEKNIRFKKNAFEVSFDVIVDAKPCDLIVSNGTYTATLSWRAFEI